MRLHLAHLFWESIEPNVGATSSWQNGEVNLAIKKWEEIVSKRKSNLEKLWIYAVPGLDKPGDRLPSVIPVYCSQSEDAIAEAGIVAGYRMFLNVKKNSEISVIKVVPVPIHQEVNQEWLTKAIDNLKLKKM
jgi:hypothetical protein